MIINFEIIKNRFKRPIKLNKYRPNVFNKKTPKNNLNYLIDQISTKANKLFFLSFENDNRNENDRFFYLKYFAPKVEMRDLY